MLMCKLAIKNVKSKYSIMKVHMCNLVILFNHVANTNKTKISVVAKLIHYPVCVNLFTDILQDVMAALLFIVGPQSWDSLVACYILSLFCLRYNCSVLRNTTN